MILLILREYLSLGMYVPIGILIGHFWSFFKHTEDVTFEKFFAEFDSTLCITIFMGFLFWPYFVYKGLKILIRDIRKTRT